jgi:hypothetical protein
MTRASFPRILPPMGERTPTTLDDARRVGDTIGVDWSRFALEQFRAGMDVEFEHGVHDPQTDVTGDDPIITGKIALAHLKEFPDYYERLERMERQAERERLQGWSTTPAEKGPP